MPDYKQLLLQRRIELQQSLASITLAAKPVDLEESMGRLARMDAIAQQQMQLNARKQIEMNLNQITQALDRLESGDFGICKSCEEEIPEKRLLVRPETPFCVRCQK